MNLPLGSNPIRVLLVPVALLAFATAGQAFLDGADTRGILAAVFGALVVAAQEIGRRLVTPVPTGKRSSWSTPESGQGIVEAILIVFLIAVCLIVIFHFA